jgi:flagellar secretion chaperone FliS
MNGLRNYTETAVTTENNGRLIVLLYEGAIKFLNISIRELEAGNMSAKGAYIQKAVDIIHELNSVLDMEVGGELANNLRSLYNFFIRHLYEANQQCDPGKIREVIGCLNELNDGWKSVS